MTEKLYTPEILGLGARLYNYPLGDELELRGWCRSASCGSELHIGLACNSHGEIVNIGVRAQACAIGQAAAALFALAALGQTHDSIVRAEHDISAWLAGEGTMPSWPGLDVLAPACAYPARHGAVLLGWRAALAALSPTQAKGTSQNDR